MAEDGSIEEREITIGISNRVHAEVLSGLKEGGVDWAQDDNNKPLITADMRAAVEKAGGSVELPAPQPSEHEKKLVRRDANKAAKAK